MAKRDRMSRAPVWETQGFWDAVDAETRDADAPELERFLTAERMPFSLRPGFEAELWQSLRARLDR